MEINHKIKELLIARGITEGPELEEYLSDKPQKTYDPFLLHHMEAGVDLILSSIDMGKKICIYGDYDADGVTSVSLLRGFLKEIGADVSYYIPSRFDEGYGLNNAALDTIKGKGADLVITVDCGCTSVAEVAHAKEIGLEIIVTDHHALKDDIPDCILIDPQHPDCKYPCKYLAGVGVAFKVAQAIRMTLGLEKELTTKYLDLVAIGTVADIVPLLDENRTLVKHGLKVLNISKRPGLVALINRIGMKQGEIKSRNISFGIAPHINAAGRVKDGTLAARLLQTSDEAQALKLADELAECNQLRKTIQADLLKQSDSIIEDLDPASNKSIVVPLKDANEGVIGIVAGNLKDKYNVPTLVLTSIGDGEYKGAGRSLDTINIFKILNKFNDKFVRFGGHAAACGFTIKEEYIDELARFLKDEVGKLYNENPELFSLEHKPDVVLESKDINLDFLSSINAMEPFGKKNESPLVGVELSDYRFGRMGPERKSFWLEGNAPGGKAVRCVNFQMGDELEEKLKNNPSSNKVMVLGDLRGNEWNGNVSVEMTIKNLELIS